MTSEHITIGILAPVDAGKTTLSESVLYLSGAIRKAGRVDHKDAYLDTDELEKTRGITIFSKPASFQLAEQKFTLLDTPGHADFSPEMERTLQVLDAAVLVISAADGVTGQVRVLWSLLQHYEIPVFLFVNKMDQPGAERREILAQLQRMLHQHVTAFGKWQGNILTDMSVLRGASGLAEMPLSGSASGTEEMSFSGGASDTTDALGMSWQEWQENVAVCSEPLMEQYLSGEVITQENVTALIRKREIFPCYFGSALRMEGVRELLEGLAGFPCARQYQETFAARVFKITRDNGIRLTWMKVTGGILKVRDSISQNKNEQNIVEKVDQIRIYSGEKFDAVQQAEAGTICAVTGLTATCTGQGLGREQAGEKELLQPILNCRVLLTDDEDPFLIWQKLQILEEEEPMLHVTRQEQTGNIHVQVMGRVQMEILRYQMEKRFQMPIDFGPAEIVYKETIAAPVEGVGHFEPLRHYAEVHLMLEPTGPGSGLNFAADCSLDELDRNWQRLVLSNLEGKKHIGVLTGSEITDMKITLVAGRASTKHTEGGDFREASLRAVRQGLMMAENILLEPVLEIRLELPQESIGRALSDLQRMNAVTLAPELEHGKAIIRGTIPAACLGNYAEEVSSYTRGEGRLSVSLKGYEPCHNAEEVIAARDYHPDLDVENPSSSVFCAHGVGTIFSWDQVRSMMHVESGWKPVQEESASQYDAALSEYNVEKMQAFRGRESADRPDRRSFKEKERDYQATENELNAIFERTYGSVKSRYTAAPTGTRIYENTGAGEKTENDGEVRSAADGKTVSQDGKYTARAAKKPEKEYLLVDGYNILFASEELKALAAIDIKAARDSLMDILSNFQGYRRETVILVFDAYKVEGGQEKVLKYHNLNIVYTREAETADQYIEKAAHEIQKKYHVTVATSDAVEQVIVFGSGAMRLSARDFWEQVHLTQEAIRDKHLRKIPEKLHNYVLPSNLSEEK